MNYILALALPVLCLSQIASAEAIYVMNTHEFKNIRHSEGKTLYAKKAIVILKKMRIKTPKFDAMKADSEEVYALIQNNKEDWSAVEAQIEKQCKKDPKNDDCLDLEDLRVDILEFIQKNPQQYGDSGEPPAAIR